MGSSLGDVMNWIRDHRYFVGASAGVLTLYTVLQIFLLQTGMHGYDSFRDLVVAKEIAQRGTFSYFGQAYSVNPPLSYLMRAAVIKIAGFSLVAQKALGILMFFLGQVLVYATSRNFWSKKRSLYVFLVSSLSWSFVMATRIRSFAYMMLFSGLIFYTYTRYLEDCTRRNAALVGVSLGLGMLAKSSFAFLVILLSLHHFLRWLKDGTNEDIIQYGIFGSVASLLYIPYLAYQAVNGLQMPWTAQQMTVTGEAAWLEGFTPESHLFLYRRLVEMYPVMTTVTVAGLILFRNKIRQKLYRPLGFMALVAGLGPLLGRLVLAKVHVYVMFFIFIPLPFLTVWTVKTWLEEKEPSLSLPGKLEDLTSGQIITAMLVLAAGIHGTAKIQENTGPLGSHISPSAEGFIEDLGPQDTVMSEDSYVRLHALSDAYIENADSPSRGLLLRYGADHYISKNPRNRTYLEKYGEIQLSGKTRYIYNFSYQNLQGIDVKTTQTVNNEGDHVSYVICQVAGEGWRNTHVSGRDGELTYATPEGYRGPEQARCRALGYQDYRGRTQPYIDLGPEKPLNHRYDNSRY